MKTTHNWNAIRSQFHLDDSVCMLNCGSFGPLPHRVFDRVTAIRRELAAGPTDFFVRKAPPLLWEARTRLADFLQTTPQRLVFTTNVSAAINLVASSLPITSPGEILLTDHEYGAMVWCWERVAQRLGLTIRTFPLPTMPGDEQEIVDAATQAMNSRTRVFFFSHVLSPTGLVLPARALCTEARKRGITTVVDGAHAPAMIPLNLTEIAADFYTGNCHKWLFAPTGTGFLQIGPGQEGRLQPLHVSWGYHPDRYPLGDTTASLNSDERDAYGSTPAIRYLEFEGTRDICPWLTVPAAIDYQTEIGFDAIRERCFALSRYTRQAFATKLGWKPATPDDPRFHGMLSAFEIPGRLPAAEWRARLWNERIEIPIIERPDRLLIRVSHAVFTQEFEIDRLVNMLAAQL